MRFFTSFLVIVSAVIAVTAYYLRESEEDTTLAASTTTYSIFRSFRSIHSRVTMSKSSSLTYREPKVVNAPQKHTATIIFLHGLGDSGFGWEPVASMLSPSMPYVKWILPHAPSRPVTLNYGMRMPAWYDIYSLDKVDHKEDEEGHEESFKYVDSLIKKEVDAGIPSNRIILGGFSQGGAVALNTGVRTNSQIAGLVALSTYLPMHKQLSKIDSVNKKVPIFMAHGTEDPVIHYSIGNMSAQHLKELGFDNLTFKTYEGMAHSSSNEELRDLLLFLKRVIPSQ